MDDQSVLWEEISQALAWKLPKKDASPIHRFNRLVKEHFPSIQIWLDAGTCVARDQLLSREDVEALQPWHKRPDPGQAGGKIVLFSHLGTNAIVDGNHRIATYLENNDQYEIPSIMAQLK